MSAWQELKDLRQLDKEKSLHLQIAIFPPTFQLKVNVIFTSASRHLENRNVSKY